MHGQQNIKKCYWLLKIDDFYQQFLSLILCVRFWRGIRREGEGVDGF